MDPIHESYIKGLGRGNPARRGEEFNSAGPTDEARQSLRSTPTRDDSKLCTRMSELGGRCCNANVTR